MDSGTVHNSESSVKKGTRRKWLPFEEDALLTVLEDFVTRGHRCDTGSFKSGTLVQMEKVLDVLCPNSKIKANPHIESKLKKWKKTYSIIYDMSNTSGFAWNDVKKCIEVDSDDAWKTYVHVCVALFNQIPILYFLSVHGCICFIFVHY